MIILTIRTDNPTAEIGLFDGRDRLSYVKWQAHKQLAETINTKIKEMLSEQKTKINDISGVLVYKGPGSFTGLRIGISVANALAGSLNCPIISENGDWIETGIAKLLDGKSDKVALPEYGSPVHITQQKK